MKNIVSNVVCLILSLFFSGMILFALFGVFNASILPAFPFLIGFTALSLAAMVGINCFGTRIIQKFGAGCFWAMDVLTGFYVALQFIASIIYIIFPFMTGAFVLIEMLLLFFYALCITPVFMVGVRDSKKA